VCLLYRQYSNFQRSFCDLTSSSLIKIACLSPTFTPISSNSEIIAKMSILVLDIIIVPFSIGRCCWDLLVKIVEGDIVKSVARFQSDPFRLNYFMIQWTSSIRRPSSLLKTMGHKILYHCSRFRASRRNPLRCCKLFSFQRRLQKPVDLDDFVIEKACQVAGNLEDPIYLLPMLREQLTKSSSLRTIWWITSFIIQGSST
jgi:hypothetical protein